MMLLLAKTISYHKSLGRQLMNSLEITKNNMTSFHSGYSDYKRANELRSDIKSYPRYFDYNGADLYYNYRLFHSDREEQESYICVTETNPYSCCLTGSPSCKYPDGFHGDEKNLLYLCNTCRCNICIEKK